MNDLIDAQGFRANNTPLTAYLFTSSGQKSEIDIFHLPSNVVSFITSAKRRYPHSWGEIVQRAWALQDDSVEVSDGSKIVHQDRNYFYEDVFGLPHNAYGFLRRYFLRRPILGKAVGKQKLDPRFNYSFVNDREMISWELTGLFLEKVMKMDKDRIADIKNLGDRLAKFIQEQDARLFKKLFLAKNDYQLRLELLRAANAANEKLLPYEEFISVFFIDEGDTAKPDWYLARDLLMVRIIEQLRGEWIESHKELLDEVNQATEEQQD
jgi:CRISPR-associated protein Cst1